MYFRSIQLLANDNTSPFVIYNIINIYMAKPNIHNKMAFKYMIHSVSTFILMAYKYSINQKGVCFHIYIDSYIYIFGNCVHYFCICCQHIICKLVYTVYVYILACLQDIMTYTETFLVCIHYFVCFMCFVDLKQHQQQFILLSVEEDNGCPLAQYFRQVWAPIKTTYLPQASWIALLHSIMRHPQCDSNIY